MTQTNKHKWLVGLGVWNLYFLVKFWLHLNQWIQIDFAANLALFCFIAIQLPTKLLNSFKQLTALLWAILLLYSESWLPPLSNLTENFYLLSQFSVQYVADLFGRFISIELIYPLIIATVSYIYLSRWIRFTTLSLVGLLSLPAYSLLNSNTPMVKEQRSETPQAPQVQAITKQKIVPVIDADNPQQALDQFYQIQQSLEPVVFAPNDKANFDVLILNICSLSWADLQAAGIDSKSLFKDYDMVFKHYNSATSYSGPAALRILRASCGQVPHNQLFSDSNEKQCYLFENLKKLGYQTSLAMNHDGHFDNFIGLIKQQGHLEHNPILLKNQPISQYAFDNTPVYKDINLLSDWFSQYKGSGQPQAFYYNTISLHDGNQIINQKPLSEVESYALRVKILFSDINTFIRQIEQSGRKTMLIIVPEHGAALKGDKMQFSGLREIPSPNIVSVPVAVKFIGKSNQQAEPIYIEQNTSHYALSTLIKGAMESHIFYNDLPLSQLTQTLPKSTLVAENEGAILMEFNNTPYIKLSNSDWMIYPGYQ
ncbi:cellulose biosynthesis protein BcsG [Catenovulum sp. 2E275]|uniref:cellulose biosynthesis protein BcsG n=1 Tax=Catenovulum sp. 2E275 TaxID=2980497 RepID=UPI0021D014AB|nr:cellulose biosynthesis protein BcsG [Catenovulum sp. 2E275]MCU4677040.1 cellulose biosynthesis protein BcsG [Catenovulum sp. 2E275]